MHFAESGRAFRILVLVFVIALCAGCHGGSSSDSGSENGGVKGEDVTWKISSITVQSVPDGAPPVLEETYAYTYDRQARTIREERLFSEEKDRRLSTYTFTDTGWKCRYEIDTDRNGSVNIASDNEYDLIRGFVSDSQTFDYSDYDGYDTWYGSYVYTYIFDSHGSHERTEYEYNSTGYIDAQEEVYVEEVIDNTYDASDRLTRQDIYREGGEEIDCSFEFTYGSTGRVSTVFKKEFSYNPSGTVDVVTRRIYTRVDDSPSEWDYNAFADYLIGSQPTALVSFRNIDGRFVEIREEIYRGNDSVRDSVTNLTYDHDWHLLEKEVDSDDDGEADSTVTHTLTFDGNGNLAKVETAGRIVTYTWVQQ